MVHHLMTSNFGANSSQKRRSGPAQASDDAEKQRLAELRRRSARSLVHAKRAHADESRGFLLRGKLTVNFGIKKIVLFNSVSSMNFLIVFS